MKVYYLICGYRGSGKDSLYKWFCGDRTHEWRRLIYKTIPTELLIDGINTVRIGFADSLKAEVLKLLGLPIFNHEMYKDKPLSEIENIVRTHICQPIDKNQSLRDVYISYGTEKRRQDPEFWCQRLFERVADEDSVCITDWRYPNEMEFFKDKGEVITIRVFRKDVPIPPEPVEHQLDGFKTDLVFIPPSDEEFEAFLRRFPQYA